MPEYSLATAIWPNGVPFDQVIAELAGAGFRQCELFGPKDLADERTAGERRAVLNRHGVWVRTVHSDLSVDLASLDDDDRTRAVAAVASCFEPFAELGGFAVIVHPSGRGDGESRAEDLEIRIDAIRHSMDTLTAQAEALGIRLAFENLQHKGAPRPLCRMEDLRRVVDDYPSTVGICLDTGHANNNGLDPADEARIAGERLIALHMQDTDALEDRHWPPGLGNIDWRRFGAALTEIGFDGAWTFEVGTGASGPAATAALVRRIADAWAAGRAPSNLPETETAAGFHTLK
ncbi:MAG: sugar phosphate isomerase/epimerase [Chloroflexota bacterium]|nr:sugar phosphate isomerase/epimerase [Chloroflexota bacterium]